MPKKENAMNHFYYIFKEQINNGIVDEYGDIISPNSRFYRIFGTGSLGQ